MSWPPRSEKALIWQFQIIAWEMPQVQEAHRTQGSGWGGLQCWLQGRGDIWSVNLLPRGKTHFHTSKCSSCVICSDWHSDNYLSLFKTTPDSAPFLQKMENKHNIQHRAVRDVAALWMLPVRNVINVLISFLFLSPTITRIKCYQLMFQQADGFKRWPHWHIRWVEEKRVKLS